MLLPMKLGYSEFDLSGVQRYPLASRPSKVRREAFATAHVPGASVAQFVAALPKLLAAAELTAAGRLLSVAGGGDTVAALAAAGVEDRFSYVSTAGGAFLEWLEGKTLPGVAALAVRRA